MSRKAKAKRGHGRGQSLSTFRVKWNKLKVYLITKNGQPISGQDMKRQLIILLLTLGLLSCRKDKPLFDGQSCGGSCYILTGKLFEVQSNLPLANTELKFYFRENGYFIFYDPTKFLGRTTTAADGSYTFKFDSKQFENIKGSFRIEGTKNGYIFNNKGDTADPVLSRFYLDSSNINISQINNLFLYKSTTLRLKIKATSITNFDWLTITYDYGKNGYGPAIKGNRTIDTTFIYKTASDRPTYINWNARGNGVNIYKSDTLIIPAGTEGIYQVNL